MYPVQYMSDGKVALSIRSISDAQIALEDLKFKKKELQIKKKEISEHMRQIRSSYTDSNLRRMSSFRGGGWLGKVVRAFQTAERDNARFTLAEAIEPFEEQRRILEGSLISVEKAIFTIQQYLDAYDV